jgi:nucleotide-binding universal stress UspA family protein
MDGNTTCSGVAFQNILVAVDGSEESLRAIDTAVKMASDKDGAQVIVLHVIEIPSFVYYQTDDITNQMISKGKAELEKWVNQIVNSQKELNVKLRTHIIVSIFSVYSEIVKYAEEQGTDLVIVGTRGRTGLKRLLLGSVASNVVTYAPCTVMVVK